MEQTLLLMLSSGKCLVLTVIENFFTTDPRVNELLIDSDRSLTIVRGNDRQLAESLFADSTTMIRWLQDFAFAQGVRLDPRKPYSGGVCQQSHLRWHCLIPPIAVDGPILSFRRHAFNNLSLTSFADPHGLLTDCQRLVTTGKPLLICGATASGKTTFLAALLRELCCQQRVMIIESITELPLLSKLWVRCQAREAGVSDDAFVNLETLIEEILRLRPDRFVIGEVRGQEIIALLKALTIGHLGLLTTLHAESPQQASARLDLLTALYTRANPDKGLNLSELYCLILERGDPPIIRELTELNARHVLTSGSGETRTI